MNKDIQPYEITLKNCVFYAYHGYFEEEQKIGQRFEVDAVMSAVPGERLDRVQLQDTVHYGEAFAIIERLVTQEKFNLIETLAYTIAKSLCEELGHVETAKVSVRKPSVPIDGVLDYAEVTVNYP